MEKQRVDEVGTEESVPLTIDRNGVTRHEFQAWIPDDVLVYKINGFISQQAAKILKVSRDVVKLRVGTKSLIPWNRNDQELPFTLILKFDRSDASNASMAHVSVEVRPSAWNASRDLILERSADIIREVRGCLMAQDIQGRTVQFAHRDVPQQ